MGGVPEAGVMVKAEEVLSGVIFNCVLVVCWPSRPRDCVKI